MKPRHLPPDLSQTKIELRAITDTVNRSRAEVEAIAEPFIGTSREDVLTLIHEAERQLRVATRALQRAIGALDN